MKSPRQLVLRSNGRGAEIETSAARAMPVVGREALVGVVLLVLAIATDRFSLHAGSIRLRTELITGGLIALWFFIRGRGAILRQLGPVEYCLLGWLGANIVSSLFFSPSPQDSLKNAIIIAGVLTIYFAGLMVFSSARVIMWAAVAWVAIGAVVATIGLIEALAYTFVGWTGGVNLERAYTDGIFILTPRVQSTMWEPNIFGSYEVTVGVLALALCLSPEFRPPNRQRWMRLAAGCAFCGVMLSMTRTVWVIGPLMVVLLVALCIRLRLARAGEIIKIMLLPVGAGIVIGLLVGNFLIPTLRWERGDPWRLTYEQVEQAVPYLIKGQRPQIGELNEPPVAAPGTGATAATTPEITTGSTLIGKVQDVTSPGTASSVHVRVQVTSQAFEGWLRRPLAGWGTGTYSLIYPLDANSSEGYWISNLEMHALFDTGIVGLALLAGAFVVVALRGKRALLTSVSPWDSSHFILLGLMVGGAGLLLAYQVTDGTWLGVTWVFFALLVMSSKSAGAASRRDDRAAAR